jgi:DNA-binding MarR family transcriptional regulator
LPGEVQLSKIVSYETNVKELFHVKRSGRAPEFRLELFLPYRLSVLANRLSREFARRYQDEFGLSIPEWRVIAVLGAFAPLSSNEIGDKTEMDKAKVSRAVATLLKSGRIERAAHPTDQRLIQLTLSWQGRKIYDAVAQRIGADPRTAGSSGRADRVRRDRVAPNKKPRP